MVVLVVLICVVIAAGWFGGCYLAFRAVRRRALRIERSSAEVPDKVHDLQRLLLVTMWSVMGALVLLVAASGGVAGALAGAHHHHHSHATAGAVSVAIGAGLLGLAAMLVPMIAMMRAVRPSLARVRDVPLRVPGRRRRALTAVIVMGGYVAVIAAGILLVPRHGTGHAIGMVAVYVVALLVLTSVLAPLAMVRLRTSPMPSAQRAELRRLAEHVGVRVRDFRVLKVRGQKVANAAQLGTVPGLRYVVVTDYLMDNLDDAELEAVVAHELGHARRHHLLIKLGAVLGIWAVLEAIVVLIKQTAGGTPGALLALPILIALPVGMIVVQGVVGVRLERAADDIAAHEVGPKPLIAALERLGELNHTKKNTGRAWSIITQHPGLNDRLRHLREMPRAS